MEKKLEKQLEKEDKVTNVTDEVMKDTLDESNEEQTDVAKATQEVSALKTKFVDRNANSKTTTQNNKYRRMKARAPKEFEEKLIDVARVTNVVKGGRRFSFSAIIVVGNGKGKIGLGHGKSLEVPDAIKKGVKDAQKKIIYVPISKNRTIPHEETGKYGASKILIKPAPKGTGIIASGTVRTIMQLAGYQDIYTKCFGSRNKKNVTKATFAALQKLRTAQEIATLRDKNIKEII